MIRIGGRISNTDARIDYANKAIQNVHKEVLETDQWVEELEAFLSDLESRHAEVRDEIALEKMKTLDVSQRLDWCREQLEELKSRPAPLIPDISPLRAEIRLVRVVLDELMIGHNEEMTALWRTLGQATKHTDSIEARVDSIVIPDLAPIKKWLVVLTTINFVWAAAWIISIFQ